MCSFLCSTTHTRVAVHQLRCFAVHGIGFGSYKAICPSYTVLLTRFMSVLHRRSIEHIPLSGIILLCKQTSKCLYYIIIIKVVCLLILPFRSGCSLRFIGTHFLILVIVCDACSSDNHIIPRYNTSRVRGHRFTSSVSNVGIYKSYIILLLLYIIDIALHNYIGKCARAVLHDYTIPYIYIYTILYYTLAVTLGSCTIATHNIILYRY